MIPELNRVAKWIVAIVWLIVAPEMLIASEIDQQELTKLDRYLQLLEKGAAGDARTVDDLAEISWPGIQRIVESYTSLNEPIAPHTQRAYQSLLERTTRSLLLPWHLAEVYSPELTEAVNLPSGSKNSPWQKLFESLTAFHPDRRAWDLAVRLTPIQVLDELAQPLPEAAETASLQRRLELIAAWNRRLARGGFSQPIPESERRWRLLGDRLMAISANELFEPQLELLGRREPVRYAQLLAEALAHTDRKIVLAALRTQEKLPARLDLNTTIIERFRNDSVLIEQAVKSFISDHASDHSATLRTIWPSLPEPPSRARYFALLAMAVHSQGNQELALQALKQQPFEYLDAALGVLRSGPEIPARDAVSFLLNQPRGHEEALRLAAERKLARFEEPALRIALEESRDVVARQAALRYLQTARPSVRRKLVGLLSHKNGDLRLAAIQAFRSAADLGEADRDEIGPALIQVAQQDSSEGHRQEAMYVLGQWQDKQAMPFFQQVLAQNPPIVLADEPFNNAQYWRYRFRLVALVGLARLNDAVALDELTKLHRTGGPTERMDVLLAMMSLRKCPDWVQQDWHSSEPKLVATAVRLTLDHGSAELKKALQKEFESRPLWQAFADSGVDDHNVLKMISELKAE